MKQVTFTKWKEADYFLQEDINTVVTNLKFSGANIKSVCLTSYNENEGKSFVSMELARAFAKDGKKVILVDADLRKSRIEFHYGMEGGEGVQGLSHYLCNITSNLDDVVLETNIENMYLILAGQPVLNPPTLFGADLFKNLIKELESQYDLVIVDCPPIGAVIDGAVISTSCSGVILVVAQNGCSRKQLNYVKQQLVNVNANIIGAVLNKSNSSSGMYGLGGLYEKVTGKYGKSGSKYGKYGKYGSQYGETTTEKTEENK